LAIHWAGLEVKYPQHVLFKQKHCYLPPQFNSKIGSTVFFQNT